MHLLQSYSLQAGQKIRRIYTYEKYYPLPFDSYIVFQPWSKNSKNYSYWEEVLKLIAPKLLDINCQIVQVGAKDEKALPLCFHTQGTTSFNQLEFLISKAKLVVTADSISSHLAGTYDIPRVILVSNNYKECVSPYFGTKDKEIVIEPACRGKGVKPVFSFDDPTRAIDEIPPEQIAASVCKLLNLDFNHPFKTIKFGFSYNQKMIETALDSVIDLSSLKIPSIICRFDYNANEQFLEQQMRVGQVSIITNRPINIDLLKNYKSQINEIFYFVERNNPPEFIGQTVNLGIKSHLLTRLSPEELNKRKLAFLDYGLIVPRLPQFEPQTIGVSLDKLFYKTGKYTLSKGLIYPSKAAYCKGLNINSFETDPLPIINDLTFWAESEHFMFSTLD